MKIINTSFQDFQKLFNLIAVLGIVFILAACNGGGNSSSALDTQPVIMEMETQPGVAESNSTEEPAPTTPPTVMQAAPESTEPQEDDTALQESSIDACLLITKEEAEAALGKPVGEPTLEIYPMVSSCSYTAEDLDGVSIVVIEYENASAAADSFQMELDINSYEEVDGIGERALKPYPIMDLAALIRNYEVSIDLATGDFESEYLLARDLMVTALSRMP
jgi:hypothetical protein